MDRRRVLEVDLEPEVGLERRLDHFLLNLAVQRDGVLVQDLVLLDVDQRVLLGELRQRCAEPRAIVRIACHDDGFQGRRRELRALSRGARFADAVADLDVGETPQLRDPARGDRLALNGRALLEDSDRRHLALETRAEAQPVACADRPREHPHVGDLLAVRRSLDLEHGGRGCGVRVARRGREAAPRFRSSRRRRRHPSARSRSTPDARARAASGTRAARAGGPAERSTRRRRTTPGALRRSRRALRGAPSRRRDASRTRLACPARPAPTSGRPLAPRRSEIARSTRSSSAPARSILFTNRSVGIRSRWSARIRIRVCGWTPSTAEITSTAPSRTLSTRSTSAMKSGWPGVSIRLTWTSPSANEVTADLIVIPRWRSRSRVSVWVVPASTLPISSMTPASYRSRSVRVVLPASTCATIPRLSSLCDTRHFLQMDPRGLVDGYERVAHRLSLAGERWTYLAGIIRGG